MKKTSLFVLALFSLLLISACAKQQNNEMVGQGSDVPQETGTTETQPKEPTQTQDSEVKEFRIEARQFTFNPSTIEVNKGDKVRLIVTSVDVPHGFAIEEYGINERLDVGKPKVIEFTADKEGAFTAFCSVFCGSGHSNMKGKIIVK